MQPVTTILLDCGGVLTPDPWETTLLHEEHGLARASYRSVDELVEKVRHVWDKYAIWPDGKEEGFWRDMEQASGVTLDPREIERVKAEVVKPNPTALPALQYLRSKGRKIGIISNSTAFFYGLQGCLLSLADYIDKDLEFLSHECHVTKSNGLFELAAKKTSPSETLIIDDRSHNVSYAGRLGFQAEQYLMHTDGSLLELIKRYVD